MLGGGGACHGSLAGFPSQTQHHPQGVVGHVQGCNVVMHDGG